MLGSVVGAVGLASIIAFGGGISAITEEAHTVEFTVRYSLSEELRYDLPVGVSPGHWIRAARFQGIVAEGPLDGASADEYGLHEVFPGREGAGAPIFHVLTASDGSTLTIRGDRRFVTFPSPDSGEPLNVYTGAWTIVGATGAFDGVQGGGLIRVRPMSSTEIVQEFTGILRGI